MICAKLPQENLDYDPLDIYRTKKAAREHCDIRKKASPPLRKHSNQSDLSKNSVMNIYPKPAQDAAASVDIIK